VSNEIVVAVVADPSLIADRYGTLTTLAPELRVAATVSSVNDLAVGVSAVRVALVDLRLSDGSSPADNIGALVAAGVSVLAVSSAEDRTIIQQAARAGAVGLLRKTAEPGHIVDAIRRAARGAEYVTADWAAAIDADPLLAEVPLTAEQEAVLAALASGEPAESLVTRMRVSAQHLHDLVGAVRQQLTRVANLSAPALQQHPPHHQDGASPVRDIS
jgi:two-component system response regulator DevR